MNSIIVASQNKNTKYNNNKNKVQHQLVAAAPPPPVYDDFNNSAAVQVYSKNQPQDQEQYNNIVHPSNMHHIDFASSYTTTHLHDSPSSWFGQQQNQNQEQQQQLFVAKPSSTADRVEIRTQEDYVRCIHHRVAAGMTKEELKIQATYDDLEVEAPSQELRSSWWWRNNKSAELQMYQETDDLPRLRPPVLFRNKNVKVPGEVQQKQQETKIVNNHNNNNFNRNQNDDDESYLKEINNNNNTTSERIITNEPSAQYSNQIFDLVRNRRDDGFHYRNGIYDHTNAAKTSKNKMLTQMMMIEENHVIISTPQQTQQQNMNDDVEDETPTVNHSDNEEEEQEGPMTISKRFPSYNNSEDTATTTTTSCCRDDKESSLLLPPLPFSKQQQQQTQICCYSSSQQRHRYFVAFRAHRDWFQYNPAQLHRENLEREQKVRRGEYNNDDMNQSCYFDEIDEELQNFDEISYNNASGVIIREGDFVVVQGDNGGIDIGRVLSLVVENDDQHDAASSSFSSTRHLPHIFGLADQNQIQLLLQHSDPDALSVIHFLDSLPYDLIHLRNIVRDHNYYNNYQYQSTSSLHQARQSANDSLLDVYPHCPPSEAAIKEILDLYKTYNFINAEFQFDKSSLCIYFAESRRYYLREKTSWKQRRMMFGDENQHYATSEPLFVMEDEENFYYPQDFGSLITCLYRKFGCRIWLINCSRHAPQIERHPFHNGNNNNIQHQEFNQDQNEFDQQLPVYPSSHDDINNNFNKIPYLEPEEVETDHGDISHDDENMMMNLEHEQQQHHQIVDESHFSLPSVHYSNNNTSNNNSNNTDDNEDDEEDTNLIPQPRSFQQNNNNSIFGTQNELNLLFQRRREQFQRDLMKPVLQVPIPENLTAEVRDVLETEFKAEKKQIKQENYHSRPVATRPKKRMWYPRPGLWQKK